MIKKYLREREREICIYEPTPDINDVVITVDHNLYDNYYFEIHNKDFGYITITFESIDNRHKIKIKIHEYKKYTISRNVSCTTGIIIIKDAQVKYIDKYTIHVM